MIDRVELAAASFCVLLILYSLVASWIPIHLVILMGIGVVSAIFFLSPHFKD